MTKFIKLTNSQPYSIDGRPLKVVNETILSTDRICSLMQNGNEYRIVFYSDIINVEHMTVQHTTSHAIISKEDYEAARKILIDDGSDDHESEQVVEVPAEVSMQKVEKKQITKALIECPDKVSAAAKLGMSIESLNSKIKEYGICWPDKNFKQ